MQSKMASVKRAADADEKSSKKVKKGGYNQVFLEEYAAIKGIRASRLGPMYAFCAYCVKDISISHSGRYDIDRHRGTKQHGPK